MMQPLRSAANRTLLQTCQRARFFSSEQPPIIKEAAKRTFADLALTFLLGGAVFGLVKYIDNKEKILRTEVSREQGDLKFRVDVLEWKTTDKKKKPDFRDE